MKHDIQKAYDSAAPSQAEALRIYEKILRRAETEDRTAPRSRTYAPRRLLVAAAVLAAIALLATAGYAAYQHWRLPEPVSYAPDEHGIIIKEHERTDYELAELDSSAPSETGATDAPDAAALTDAEFIQKGTEILEQVGMLDLRPEQLTVVRQENLFWGREEAEVLFEQGDVRTSVKFNAATGKFLGMFGVDWQLEGSAACASDADAAALAQRYYEALPVEQGYEMTHVEKYDEQYWSYDFCREVEPGVYNQYEMVRVAVNPVSGRLTGCTVFYVPLLDDHEPGQERITQQQAEQLAEGHVPEGMELIGAEVVIGFPNWMFTEWSGANLRASDVTRWAWELTYERPNSEFADRLWILVDCYTGEILGGDLTG